MTATCLAVRLIPFGRVPSTEGSIRVIPGSESHPVIRSLLYPTEFIGYTRSVRNGDPAVNQIEQDLSNHRQLRAHGDIQRVTLPSRANR